MSATRAHFIILLALCLLGIAEWMMEAQMAFSGGLFPRYGITKLIWLGIGIYALVSSVLVFLVGAICRFRTLPYTALGVLLTHGIPVILIVTSLYLGIHDRIDDALRKKDIASSSEPISAQPPKATIREPRPPLSAPLSIQLPQAASDRVPLISEPVNVKNKTP